MRKHPRALVGALLALAAGVALAAGGAAVREAGPYVVHYNAMSASEIDPALAEAHELPRSDDRCIVTVAVMRRNGGGAVRAMVMGEVTRPDGRMHALDLREVREGGEIYYVGDVALEDTARLDFTLKVSPGGDTPPEMIHFSRDFGAD